jgi:hypothetical protein
MRLRVTPCPDCFGQKRQGRRYIEQIQQAIAQEEKKHHGDKLSPDFDLQKIRTQRPETKPSTLEPRRCLNPRVASQNKETRVKAIRRWQHFLADYREAFERFKQGFYSVKFPFGTYWMRVYAGAACGPGCRCR